jgi:hypothetical protein
MPLRTIVEESEDSSLSFSCLKKKKNAFLWYNKTIRKNEDY